MSMYVRTKNRGEKTGRDRRSKNRKNDSFDSLELTYNPGAGFSKRPASLVAGGMFFQEYSGVMGLDG